MTIFWLKYQGSRIPLRQGETVVGRSPYCSIVVSSRRVSRQHCALRLMDGKLSVSDLGSSNGTWVNGEPVSGHRQLNPGDLIEIGDEGLEVQEHSPPQARVANDTERDLPMYHRDIDDEVEQTTVTHAQTTSVALIESMLANGSGAHSPTQHFGKVQRAIEKYLTGHHRVAPASNGMELERLRRSIEATARLDDSGAASDWRQRTLAQLADDPTSGTSRV